MQLMKILSNPVRIQIMQYLQTYGEATTKQISDSITDVPAPTLYRHINALLQEEILLVKEERKVRGSLERLLAINTRKFEENVNNSVSETAYQFLMELFMKFQKYSEQENADPQRDKLSLRTCVFTLSDEHFDCFMRDIAAVVEKYQQPDKIGKLRSVSFVSAPVEKEGE